MTKRIFKSINKGHISALEKYMRVNHITQTDLAKQIGCKRAVFTKWLYTNPTRLLAKYVDKIEEICADAINNPDPDDLEFALIKWIRAHPHERLVVEYCLAKGISPIKGLE